MCAGGGLGSGRMLRGAARCSTARPDRRPSPHHPTRCPQTTAIGWLAPEETCVTASEDTAVQFDSFLRVCVGSGGAAPSPEAAL